MIDIASVIADIQRRYALDWEGRAPIHEDIIAWSGSSSAEQAALYDQVGAELALGYHQKRFSFEFCDVVVNQLQSVMISQQFRDPPPPWPKLFWRIYEAFDAGEFANPSLPPHDPVKTNTDPAIDEIVRGL